MVILNETQAVSEYTKKMKEQIKKSCGTAKEMADNLKNADLTQGQRRTQMYEERAGNDVLNSKNYHKASKDVYTGS